jgi:excisionase family DNA binding protein
MSNKPEYPDMGSELITKDYPRLAALFRSLDGVLKRMELVLKNTKPILGGECYLTDKEVAQRLKVSRQTMQDYRNRGIIPYCRIGNKILYRQSDVEKLLEESYRQSFR